MLNDYLLHTLFSNTGENHLYNKWFSSIWGCPDLFCEFLRLASTQSQKTVALDIVRHMSSVLDFSVPCSAFANLVEVEHQGEDWGWINQEHAVHSVNVYILEIYLFFFYKPLRQQLVLYFGELCSGEAGYQSPLDEVISEIIRCLRIAALYHDLGYILERTVDLSGNFNPDSGISNDDFLTFQHIDLEVIYDITKNALSKFFLVQGLLLQNHEQLKDALNKSNWIIDDTEWIALNDGTVLSGEKLKVRLQPMGKMSQLRYIRSWEGLKYFAPYLSAENILTVASDSQFKPAVIYVGSSTNSTVYCRQDIKIEKSTLLHISEMCPDDLNRYGLHLHYYINCKELPLPVSIRHLGNSIKHIASHCSKYFSCDFSFLFSEEKIPQLLHKINEWIERKVPLYSIDSSVVQHNNRQAATDNALITTLYRKKAMQIINCQTIEFVNSEDQILKLGELFSNEIKTPDFLNNLYRDYNKASNADPDTTCDAQLQELTKIIYEVTKEAAQLSKSHKPIIEVKQTRSSQKVFFRGLEKNRFPHSQAMQQLYTRLEENAKALCLSWKDIENYMSCYNYYDHGKVSAGIFMEAYGIFSTVMENIGDDAFFKSVWQSAEDLQTLNRTFCLKDSIAEACFAILMHNIYVKTPTNQGGLNYIQDVTINAMSYFLAFCDTLQFWDRDKIFDPAKQRQPDSTYYGKDFDIDIANDRILIRCQTNGIKEKILQKLHGIDEFLKDSSNIIFVVENL